ncbi:glycosyltransferase family 39 protein [Deltaproteobacteria bacterium TL4]
MKNTLTQHEAWFLMGMLGLAILYRMPLYAYLPLAADQGLYTALGQSIARGDWFLEIDHPSDKFPLFYYAQALMFHFFGISDQTAVLPNYFANLVSIILVFLLGRAWFSASAGAIAAFLMAISPAEALYAGNAYVDSFFMMWLLSSLLALAHQRWRLLGLLIAWSLATKQTIVVFAPLYLFGIWIVEKNTVKLWERLRRLYSVAGKVLLWFFLGMLPFLGWSLFYASKPLRALSYLLDLIGFGEQQEFLWTYTQRWEMIQRALTTDAFGSLLFAWSLYGLIIVHVLLAGWKYLRSLRSKWNKESADSNIQWELGILGFSFAFIALNQFVVSRFFGTRYLIPILPFLFLLAGHALTDFYQQVPRPFLKRVPAWFQGTLAGALSLWVLCFSSGMIQDYAKQRHFHQDREVPLVANFLKQQAKPQDIFFYDSNGWGFQYYYPDAEIRRSYFFHKFHKVKPFLAQYPYRKAYMIVWFYNYSKIQEIVPLLAPDYTLDLQFQTPEGTYRIYQVSATVPAQFQPQLQALNQVSWSWQRWLQEILIKQWPHEVSVSYDHSTLRIAGKQVPFMGLSHTTLRLNAQAPVWNASESIARQWPIWTQVPDLEVQYEMTDKSLEDELREQVRQIQKINVHTDQGLTQVKASIHQQNQVIEILLEFGLKQQGDYITMDVQKLEVSGWPLTWIVRRIQSRILKLRSGYNELFNAPLTKLTQNQGLLSLTYHRTP